MKYLSDGGMHAMMWFDFAKNKQCLMSAGLNTFVQRIHLPIQHIFKSLPFGFILLANQEKLYWQAN